MLSAATLACMQGTVSRLQTTPCSIQRKSQASDGMGGYADTWTEIANVLGSIASVTGVDREAIEAGRLEEQAHYIIRLPAGTDVGIKDRIVANGVTYEVSDVKTQLFEISRVVYAIVVTS